MNGNAIPQCRLAPRGAERFGFTFEGIFRQHMIAKGVNRDTAWFSMLDGEWPAARPRSSAGSRPDNFDGNRRQKESLAAFRQYMGGESTWPED